ncbi:tetratricopeptide repeat protein [Thiobaca trueperi]|uniref:Tetratricopeptide repeat protein n=1 Tax=Thiobaca trueperi TaxID=127458 RepID=A0A4R3MVG7_9GAMM|nr:tetratricopeptide repeat protein [Thiobaca trueperi]TCT20165.1 tetratricopeptide repeat protein [Thiobaca trueperi]
MPRLSLLHWLALAAFLFFYGFTVFALTRDYYLRHPAQPVTAPSVSQGAAPQRAPSPIDTSVIPDTIVETNPELLHQRADDLFQQQRYAEAAQIYRRLIELNPDDAEVHNNLGLALHYSGDNAGAIASLKNAVAKGPALQRPWLTLGFINLQSGNPDEARSALEKARDLDPASDIGKEATRLLEVLAKR